MLAEYQASVCKTTITDTQPLEASPTRSTQRLDINNPVDSITVPLDLRPYSPAANAANVPPSTKNLNSTSPTQQHMAVVDGGASGHYFKLSDISLIRDVKMSPICDRIDVAVADGKILRSTHHGYLDVPGHRPMMAYVFPELKGSLLSVASFVDVGLELTYSSNFVTAFDLNGNMIFQGDRDTRTGLWKVDLQVFNNSSKTHQADHHTLGLGYRLCKFLAWSLWFPSIIYIYPSSRERIYSHPWLDTSQNPATST